MKKFNEGMIMAQVGAVISALAFISTVISMFVIML